MTLLSKSLRVLIIEDSVDDADLTLLELDGHGFDVVSARVETEAEMRWALLHNNWDVIISDFNLPKFDARKAMSVLREFDPDIPFIIVSGCIGEESVVELMKDGASDFVMKDKLPRLMTVISRELKDAVLRGEHRLAQEALRANEVLLREITNTLGEGLFVVNERGTLDFMNPEAERLLGWTAKELSGKELYKVIYPPNPMRTPVQIQAEQLLGVGEIYRADDVFMHKDGFRIPVSVVTTNIEKDGKAVATVTAFQDISKRKEAEQELLESRKELRELSAYLQSVREEERTRIARELHDELGQMLTGIKLKANWLISQLPKEPAVTGKAGTLSQLIDETMDAMRRTAADLRPVMLDDLGLAAAIEWLTEDFAERTEINIQLLMNKGQCKKSCKNACSSQWDESLSPEVAIAAFRIVQESLTNIVRHANAHQVKVSLCCEDGNILLRVSDDGKGISAINEKIPSSYGLIGMRERAFGLGGTLSLLSNAGKGTTVEAILPNIPTALTGVLQ